jgi:hypothetical protein
MCQIIRYSLPEGRAREKNQFGLFKITNAAITPGTHPHRVSKKTMMNEPQPFPMTERGGKMMASNTLKKLIDLELEPALPKGRLIDVCMGRKGILFVTKSQLKKTRSTVLEA